MIFSCARYRLNSYANMEKLEQPAREVGGLNSRRMNSRAAITSPSSASGLL